MGEIFEQGNVKDEYYYY